MKQFLIGVLLTLVAGYIYHNYNEKEEEYYSNKSDWIHYRNTHELKPWEL
jgi:hypothetical protein